MPSYEVIKPCYTPFGNGKLRYRAAGKLVTLTVEEAESLDGFVRPAGGETVQKLDTTPVWNPVSEPTVQNLDTEATIDQEVIEDVGDPQASDE